MWMMSLKQSNLKESTKKTGSSSTKEKQAHFIQFKESTIQTTRKKANNPNNSHITTCFFLLGRLLHLHLDVGVLRRSRAIGGSDG